MKFWKKKKKLTEIEELEKQIKLSKQFVDFLLAAQYRAYGIEIIVVIDGQVAPSGIKNLRMDKPNSQGMVLLEWLANWAVAQRYRYMADLDELKNTGTDYDGFPDTRTSRASDMGHLDDL